MRTVAIVALIVVALAVFAGAGYVVGHDDPVANAGRTPAVPAALRSTIPESAPPASTAAPRELSIVFLGDDWTAGTQASAPDKRFPALVGAALDAHVTRVDAVGAGYATGDQGSGSYLDLAARAIADGPEIVVVTGGRNDVLANDLDLVTSSASRLFARLHAGLPDAVIVAVTPFWGDSPAPATLDRVAAAVQSAASSAGVRYLDLSDPIRGHPTWMANSSDPDDQGLAAVARALVPGLRTLASQS